MSPKCNHVHPYKERGKGRFNTDTTGGSVTTEAEIAITQPQTKGCWKPPEAGGSMEQILTRDSRGNMGLPTLTVRPSCLRNCEKTQLC